MWLLLAKTMFLLNQAVFGCATKFGKLIIAFIFNIESLTFDYKEPSRIKIEYLYRKTSNFRSKLVKILLGIARLYLITKGFISCIA